MLRKPALGIWKSRDKGKEGTAGLKATTLLAPDFHWYLRRSHLYWPSLSHQRLQFKSAILPCVCCKEATRHQEVAWITTPEGWQQREELLQCPVNLSFFLGSTMKSSRGSEKLSHAQTPAPHLGKPSACSVRPNTQEGGRLWGWTSSGWAGTRM